MAAAGHHGDGGNLMRDWLLALLLPWDLLDRRWSAALAIAEIHQGLVDAGYEAASEWSPATCRDATLVTWGRFLRLPRRRGEATAVWRRRLVEWRDEPVGESGWVRSETRRVTGRERVIEFPREGFRLGFSRLGEERIGSGPAVTVGVADTERTELAAALEPGVPPRVSLNYLPLDVFDAVG